MRRRGALAAGLVPAALACALLVACDRAPREFAERAAPPAPIVQCEPTPWANPRLEVVATGLETPWGMTAAPDGRIFLTERAGRVRVIDSTGLRPEPWATLPVAHVGESGLLGVVQAFDYGESGALLVAGVYLREGRSRHVAARAVRRAFTILGGDPGTDFELRVHRLPREGERAGVAQLVVAGIPASVFHPGGVLLGRGPDSVLLSVGDSMDPWTAQDPADPRGKILSVALPGGEGGVARFGAGATTLVSGVRNPQGIVSMPGDSAMLFIDHGPTGMSVEGKRMGRDELNQLVPGGNFGWPIESGVHETPTFERPLLEWTDAIAPAGLVALAGTHPDSADLFVTGLRGQTLRRVRVTSDPDNHWTAICEETVLDARHGRLRALTLHPRGGVLVATSNRDSRGAPRLGDDQVLWLLPETAP